MQFCEYCGSETEIIGSKLVELSWGVTVTEQRRKCVKCEHTFYVMFENKDTENTDGKVN
jgi:transcriptional regulator NrdR family protein